MNLLLMRHGEAVDDAPGLGDAGRWLTGKGRNVSRSVSRHVIVHACPRAVWTSPLVRAVQTAEILAGLADLDEDVTVVRELATGDVDALVRRIATYGGPRPLCLVGHEPTLSSLAVQLLRAPRWPGFKKSGVCALQWDGRSTARFAWMLLPKHMRVVTELSELA